MQGVVVTEEMLRCKPSDVVEFMSLTRMIERFAESPEGLQFFLDGLVRFESEEASDRAVSVLRQWLLVRFEDVPESLYPLMMQVLFSSVAESSRYRRDAGFRLAISYLRVFLVGNLYPEHWPGVWTDVMKMPIDDAVLFLNTFANMVDQLQFPVERTRTVLNAMLVDGSQEAIFAFVLSKAKDDSTFMKVLRNLTKWIDPAFVLTQEMLGLLVSKIPTECCDALGTLTSLLSRPLGNDVLIEILSGCRVAECLNGNIQAFSLADLRECSVFVQKVVYRVIDFSVAEDFLPIAMHLLSVPDSAVITNIKQFFVALLSRSPDINKQPILDTILATIAMAIREKSEGTTIILDRCFHILSRMGNGNGSIFTTYLLTLASKINVRESMPEAAALLVALRDFLHQKKVRQQMDMGVLASMFQSLLTWNSELTNSYLVALGAFSSIMRTELQQTSSDFVKSMFVSCSKGLVASIEAESAAITDLEETISYLTLHFVPVLVEIPDLLVMIDAFLGSTRNVLAASASKLIACMDADKRRDVYPAAIAKLQGHDILFVLKFIKYMNLEGCEAMLQPLAGLLGSMKEAVCNERETMVHFFRACFKSLRLFAFEMLVDVIPRSPTPDIIIVLARTTPYFESVTPEAPQLQKVTQYLCDSVVSCVLPLTQHEDHMMINQTRELCHAVDAVLEFVITLFNKLTPDMKASVCSFMARCLCALPDLENFNQVMDVIGEMQEENIVAFVTQLKPAFRRILADLHRKVTHKRREQLSSLIRLISQVYTPDTMGQFVVGLVPETCSQECAMLFELIQTSPTPQKITEFLRVYRQK